MNIISKIFKRKPHVLSEMSKKEKNLVAKNSSDNSEKKSIKLQKNKDNPVFKPRTHLAWESEAVFNPGAVISAGKVHLFYRALGRDGISRIGYASSENGNDFSVRLPYPVFSDHNCDDAKKPKENWPLTSPARLVYDPSIHTSGGGWGGCEDPRTVMIEGYMYMTFNIFNGWDSMRVAVTRIKESDLLTKKWAWKDFAYLSKPGDRQKNWVLFPEKINGKFALLHNIDKGDANRVHIAYLNKLSMNESPSATSACDPHQLPDHEVVWHYRTRSAAASPIKTKDGWLLLYHAMDKNDSSKYKVGAMLLDLADPQKVLYRSLNPILEPEEWYENDYKPGIVYANGAVIKDNILHVYYGGGDKYIASASIPVKELLDNMKSGKPTNLKKQTYVRSKKI